MKSAWRRSRPTAADDATPTSLRSSPMSVSASTLWRLPGRFKPGKRRRRRAGRSLHLQRRMTLPARGKILTDFARKAYRRPVEPQEVKRLLALVAASRSAATLSSSPSPRRSKPCWFRRSSCSASSAIRSRRHGDGSPHQRLRTGLAPFVLPLEQHARRGTAARRRAEDAAQTGRTERAGNRMLSDPKAKALVEDFGGQWLAFRGSGIGPSRSEPLRAHSTTICECPSTRRRSCSSSTSCAKTGSVLDFLNGKYTFLNREAGGVLWHPRRTRA